MAVVAVDGGDELRSVVRARGEQRRGEGARRAREGSGGRVASSRAVQSEQAGWRWPGACRRASATRAPVLLA